MLWPVLLHVVKKTSGSALNLLPRSTITLKLHGLFSQTNFCSWIFMIPRANRISTSMHCKGSDSHSCLNFSSSYPSSCYSSIPCSQFSRLHKICSEDDDFDIEATKMETSFTARGYPNDLIRRRRERASNKSWAEIHESRYV